MGYDIEEIAQTLRANDITESPSAPPSQASSKPSQPSKNKVISMAGLTTVKARYTDWKTGKHALIPAIKMTIKEE